MKKPALRVVTIAAEQSAKIFLYGIIGDYWSEDPLTAQRFMRELNALEGKYSRVDVHINSPGGVVWEGLAICNAIKASRVDIHTYNDGLAASMAAAILCAPLNIENRHAAKGSLTMIHNASTIAWGNSKEMLECSKMLDAHDDVLAGIFADASGKTIEAIKSEFMDYVDHWLTAEEAAAGGLVKIENYEADKMADNIQNLSIEKVAALYTGTPEDINPSLIDKLKNIVNDIINPKNQTIDMKFPKIQALANLPAAEVTEELVNAAKTELAEVGIEGVSIVLDSEQVALIESAELATSLQEEVTSLGGQIISLSEQLAEANAKLNKPAEDSGAPKAEGDKIPDTDKEPAFNVTSVDQEKARMQADW